MQGGPPINYLLFNDLVEKLIGPAGAQGLGDLQVSLIQLLLDFLAEYYHFLTMNVDTDYQNLHRIRLGMSKNTKVPPFLV